MPVTTPYTLPYTLYQRRAIPRAGQDSPDNWPKWDLYDQPQNEGGPNPYYVIDYLPVVVNTDLILVTYGGGGVEWRDASGQIWATDDAEAQGRLNIRCT